MTKISASDAETRHDISASHEQMPNGERRFRLIDGSGVGYIRTEAGPDGAWQNSHIHHSVLETYVVQAGWIAVAQMSDSGELILRMLRPAEVWTSGIDVAHNVYMSGGAITHTVKHGQGDKADWHTNPTTQQLDRLTKTLTEPVIMSVAGR